MRLLIRDVGVSWLFLGVICYLCIVAPDLCCGVGKYKLKKCQLKLK